MLKNSRDPVTKRSTLKLEILTEDVFDAFKPLLQGGYSTTNAFWAKYECPLSKTLNCKKYNEDYIARASYVDINAVSCFFFFSFF